MALKGKLNRFKSHLTTDGKNHTIATKSNPPAKDIPQKQFEKWKAMQASPFHFDGQCAWIREVSYPLEQYYGRYRFSELKEVVEQWNESRSNHPLSANELSQQDLLFFDTETTGLGGGVGNTIFLLGYARVLDDCVVVKQFFLPTPMDEVALYQSFLTDVKELKNLVTYNGKAFDWPQVKTRHTLIRDTVPKLPAFGHFDLLHGSRRLWKDTLVSNRLSVVESDILNVQRGKDTPGHLVPLIYFEYVKEQDPFMIEGVLTHNEYDLLSLISLYIHLSKLLLSDGEVTTMKELYEIGRWYAYVGEMGKAAESFHDVATTDTEEGLLAKWHLAAIYKRQKRYDEAVHLWMKLCDVPNTYLIDSHIELAKAHEHHYKDFKKALQCAEQAKHLSKEVNKGHDHYDKRIERLTRKILLK